MDHPSKILKINATIEEEVEYWSMDMDESEIDDIYEGYPFKWKVNLEIQGIQMHGDMTTQTPGQYDGMDVEIGDLILTSDNGRYVEITSIEEATPEMVICEVEDKNLTNLISGDPGLYGTGFSEGEGILFSPKNNVANIFPLPVELPSTITSNGYTEALLRYQAEHPVKGGSELPQIIDLGEIK